MENIINEDLARAAKIMNSFSDYQSGSATARYNGLCAKFREAVEELKERFPQNATPEVLDFCEYFSNLYARKLAEAINRENRIEASCPSILISGAGNFPVRKKEKQNAARAKFWDECGELFSPTSCRYFQKIRTALTNKTVYSSDACAVEKLESKAEEMKKAHAEHIAMNAYFRKNKTMKGYGDFTDEEAERIDKKIKEGYSWEKQPFPAYHLTNETAEIRRIEQRIHEIQKMKERAESDDEQKYEQVEGLTIKENGEAMRIQLFFDEKPSEKIREILKGNGFRWAPSFGAWQRQLNANGIFATKCALREIKAEKPTVAAV